jgi:hypothetical protein
VGEGLFKNFPETTNFFRTGRTFGSYGLQELEVLEERDSRSSENYYRL